jgi:hypothetical protein
LASREEEGAVRGLPPAGNGKIFREGPKILLPKFPKPIGIATIAHGALDGERKP